VRAQFEEYLQEYERKSREHFESRGLIPARTKFSPPNLEWFVLYQFAGQSSKAIVDHLAQSGQVAEDSTVLKGVKAAAELVGWDRLPGGQGEFGTGKFTSQAIFLTPAAGAGVE